MKKLILVIFAAVLAACGGSGGDGSSMSSSSTSPSMMSRAGNQPTSAASTQSENDFLSSQFQQGIGEISLAQLALQRATNTSVKQFAQLMVDHHTQANAEIQVLASQRGVTLSSSASAESQALLTDLQGRSGNDFDRTYMAHNVAAHTSDVSQYATMFLAAIQQNAIGISTSGTTTGTLDANTAFIAFLTKMEAIFMQHLGMAKEVSGEIDPNAWLVNAWQDGLAEIRLGTLALQQAQSAQVKQFAQTMIDEHTSMNNDISQVAQAKGVTLPSDVATEQRLVSQELALITGAIFDKAYMNHNVIVHTLDVKQTQVQASSGTDAEVKALAERTLPHLQTHLQNATNLYQALPNDLLLSAWADGLGELMTSTLAVQRTTNAQVKQYAQTMINDHTQMGVEVARLAQARGRFQPIEVSSESSSAYVNTSTLTGIDFDRAYMNSNVAVHEKDVALFNDHAQNDPDAELRTFAAQTVPVLNSHLQAAQALLVQLGGSSTAGTSGTGTTGTGMTGTGMTGTGTTGTGTTGTGTTGTGTTGTGTTGTGTTGTGTTGTGTTGTGTTGIGGIGGTGFGTTGTGITSPGTTGIGTTGTGITGTGTTGTGTTGIGGIGGTGFGTTGTGITSPGTTGIGTTGTGITGTGTTGTGTTGIGGTGFGTTGTGITGTGIPSFGTAGTGTMGTSTTGMGISSVGTASIGTLGIGTTGFAAIP